MKHLFRVLYVIGLLPVMFVFNLLKFSFNTTYNFKLDTETFKKLNVFNQIIYFNKSNDTLSLLFVVGVILTIFGIPFGVTFPTYTICLIVTIILFSIVYNIDNTKIWI